MTDDHGGGEDPQQAEKRPIGLIVMIVTATLYLLVRLIQGIGWLADWVSG